jgi:hypothetical protein
VNVISRWGREEATEGVGEPGSLTGYVQTFPGEADPPGWLVGGLMYRFRILAGVLLGNLP